MVAGAFPLAQVALKAADEREAATRGSGQDGAPGLDDLPFLPEDGSLAPGEDPSSTTVSPPSSTTAGGSSSRQDVSVDEQAWIDAASSSVLARQVQGAAKLMGHDVDVPALPVDKIPAQNPLAFAITAWIAATGSTVPPDELQAQLARANALPMGLQRDLALLVLSAADATTLQHAALAGLTPEEVAWIYTHPEVAERLASGVDDDETRYLAFLSGAVDMPKSIQASLLLLQAVDATRGSLASPQARAALAALDAADLDPSTSALLALITEEAATAVTDQEKVLFAARLVASTAGVALPAAPSATSFEDALATLLASSGQTADPAALPAVLDRASALPLDLQLALGSVLVAQARAIDAANPAIYTPDGQATALAGVLVAVAQALPTLEKYNLYWRNAPDALRVTQWTPQARAGWAAEHAALLVSTRGDPTDLARAASIVGGAGLVPVEYPVLTLEQAYLGLAQLAGASTNATVRADLASTVANMDPTLRDAAAIMLSGALQSALLQRDAWQDLTAEDKAWLLTQTDGIDALYLESDITADELAKLARASLLAERVDQSALASAAAIGMKATLDAREVLAGMDAYQAQGHATRVETGLLAALKRLLPFGTASAQAEILGNPSCDTGIGLFVISDEDCRNDVWFRLPFFFNFNSAGAFSSDGCNFDPDTGVFLGCDFQESGVRNNVALLITGPGDSSQSPGTGFRQERVGNDFKFSEPPQYGAPIVTIDLGGDDEWLMPVAVTLPTSSPPVSLHLETEGDDLYGDPSRLYDAKHTFTRLYGTAIGHPTQGSAFGGGVAVLVDGLGVDTYRAATRSQGFGRYGAGMVADLGLDTDTYVATELSQGVASDTFNLGVGVLLDAGGDDGYTAKTGQGYGLGGVFLDAGGDDRYTNEGEAPLGVPIVKLEIIPGGDVTSLDERDDNRVWIDGPGALNPGIAIDTELLLALGGGDGDFDGFPDFVEFAVGTDPANDRDTPANRGTARVDLVLADFDGDGYPDYVERILSSDPEDGTSMPIGLPTGAVIVLPQSVVDALDETLLGANQLLTSLGLVYENGRIDAADLYREQNMTRSNKILDLRVPLQDAGSLEPACAPVFFNSTSMYSGVPPFFAITGFNAAGAGNSGPLQPRDDKPAQPCASVGYRVESEGDTNLTLPDAQLGSGSSFHFRLPEGILAIGDLVDSDYDVDYFLVVDLGGDDTFTNGAGGGLVVASKPPAGVSNAPTFGFVAPSLVVNVDLASRTGIQEQPAFFGRDIYANASRNYTHGSLASVLVDTSGDDVYVAGGGSQGALGGVLLDLEGADVYQAGNLSQGASLASAPPSARGEFPDGGATAQTGATATQGAVGDAPARRSVPGLLADFGDEGDTYTAGGHSQGFARAFTLTQTGAGSPTRNSAIATGILLDVAGRDVYNTQQFRGRHGQGVAGSGGVGLLADLGGGDEYLAYGVVSQGATISAVVGTGESSSQPRPATGILLDLAEDADTAADTYKVLDQYGRDINRKSRNTNLTITRSETTAQGSGANNARVYADTGLHLDGTRDSNVLNGIAGVGSDGQAIQDEGFLVNIPSARLAIGSEEDTSYAREYALVVDLGGENSYDFTAAGFIADVLVATQSASQDTQANQLDPLTTGGVAPSPTIYPVTFLLDNAGNSTYRTGERFAQGAAYFSVGVLADLGGKDSFETVAETIKATENSWMPFDAPIDGVVGVDWEDVPPQTIQVTKARDSTNSTPWTMRVANNEHSLYLALEGRTVSATESERLKDAILIDLDMGHRGMMWDFDADRTGIDQIGITFTKEGACVGSDRGFNVSLFNNLQNQAVAWAFHPDAPRGDAAVEDLEVKCRVTPSGEMTIEIRKLLVENNPRDRWDLGYRYNETLGWLYTTRSDGKSVSAGPANELGLFMRFNETGAGNHNASLSVWPPNATDVDGDFGYRRGNLSDEMQSWAVLSLARNGNAADAHSITRAPKFAQGAAFSGVGILAMLGGSEASSTLRAHDMAQGYGGYGGLGAIIDLGGSDAYVAAAKAQGASETLGLGLLLDVDGNDNYRLDASGYGWTPAAGPGIAALLMDLGGDDEYVIAHPPAANRTAGPVSLLVSASPFRNDVVLAQNSTGLFVDARLSDLVYDATATVSNVPPNLEVYQYFTGSEEDPNARCTTTHLDQAQNTKKPLASGKICLEARVHLTGAIETLNATTGSQIKVVGMDFLVDRQRVATLTEPTETLNGGNTTKWRLQLNTTDFPDGVKRVKAVPLVAVIAEGREQLVYRSRPVDEFNDSQWIKSVVFDNAPEIGLRVSPEYTGIANATYSPYAVAGKKELVVNWTISHDADEERLNAYDSYVSPPNLTNFPCVRDQHGKLCHVLPFYLPPGGSSKLTTRPGTALVGATTVGESDGGSDYNRETDALKTDLRIRKDDSFRLVIPDRTAISLSQQNYTTYIRITVENTTTGNKIEDGEKGVWYLANEVYRKQHGQVDLTVLNTLLPAARPVVDQVKTVPDIIGDTGNDPLQLAIAMAVDGSCNGGNPTACEQLTGDWGAFTARFCREPGNSIPGGRASTVGWAIQGALDTAGAPVDFCGAGLDSQLPPMVEPVDDAIPDVGPMVATPLNETICSVDECGSVETADPPAPAAAEDGPPEGWDDFRFDVNASLPDMSDQPPEKRIRWGNDGTLIIPAGYRIELSFNISTEGIVLPASIANTLRDPTRTVADTLEQTGEQSVNEVADEDDDRCVDATEETRCVPYTVDLTRDVARQIRSVRLTGIDELASLRTIPQSVFRVGGGAPESQPRLEIRVPAEPSTQVTVSLDRLNEAGEFEPVYEFASGEFEGDLAGTPTRDGYRPVAGHPTISDYVVRDGERFTLRNSTLVDDVVEDGVYYVSVKAADGAVDKGLRDPSVSRVPVLVDKSAPRTYITTDQFAGSALVQGGRIPIKWAVDTRAENGAPGTGVVNTTFLYRVGDQGELDNVSTWTIKWHDTNSLARDFIPKGDSNVYLAMAISLDEAGNLEGFRGDSGSSATFASAFHDAFLAKIGLGERPDGYHRIVVDQGRPIASSVAITGERRLMNYLGSEFAFVRAGADVQFTVCAADLDEEGAIGLVRVGLDHVDPATQQLINAAYEIRDPTGSCDDGGAAYTFSGWGDENTDRAKFPEGIWTVQFEVFDRAGNRIRVPGGSVILDHDAPTVTKLDPILPLGQSAVKPGDRVSLRLLATDAFGVDEAAITVDADGLTNETGLTTRPVRVDGVIYQEVTFTVNRQSIENKIYTVTVTVPDNAGSETVASFFVPVDFKRFAFVPDSLEVTNVTHSSAVLRWKTTENTSGGARFGISTAALNTRTPLNTSVTKEHAVKVENLAPSTRYYLRAVATSPSGFALESEIIDVETSTALFLEPLAPAKGASVSGPAKVSWKGGLLDSNGFVTYTVEVQSAPDKPWTFLTTLTRQGEQHEIVWNTTRFLDGTAYRYRISAVAGKDAANLTIGPITLDNTPASVTVLSPLIATNDTTPRIAAEARDALSGLGPGAARLLIDGTQVDGLVTDALPDGGIRVAYEVPSALAPGLRTLELRVTDKAGATAREVWKVAIDGDAPNATIHPTRYAPGIAAAKQGGTATINVTLRDLSGVASASADVSQINAGLRTARLAKLVGSDVWQVTIPVTATDAGATKTVTVTTTDLAGNTGSFGVQIPVDNVAPDVPSATVSSITHTSAIIDAPSDDEPILLSVTATAPATAPATGATRDAAKAARIKLDGLLPSRTYAYTLVATDLAGNEVTLSGSFPTLVDAKPPTSIRLNSLSVLDLLNGTLRLSWMAASDDVGVAFYRVYRSEGGAFEPIAQVHGTTYDDVGLPYEKPYTYKVAAVDHGGNEGPADERLRAAATAVPRLSAGLASPTVGSILTTFRYTVTYVSPGGVAPATIRIILDGVPQDMKLLSGEPTTGAIYVYETRLAPHKRDEPHTYAYEASDGRYTVRFPEDGSVLRGPLVSADAAGATDAGAFGAFAQRVPGGGFALTGVALLGAVVAAALVMRRKKEGSK